MAKKILLIDLLHKASAIEIDGVLCENFSLESEGTEPDDIALDINYEEDGNLYEHFITFAEIGKAKKNKRGTWSVMCNNGDWDDACKIVPYKLVEITK